MDKLDVAWAAGFFDGEGCISIRKTGGRGYGLLIQVTQVNKDPIQKFANLFGGSICLQESRGSHKPLWRWCQACRRASESIRYMLPFLIVKQEAALLALQFQNMKTRGRGLSDEQIGKELDIKNKISELNQRD